MKIKIRIINQEGKLTEVENPNSIVAVADRVTIEYFNGDYTTTSTFFIATMEIVPLTDDKPIESKNP